MLIHTGRFGGDVPALPLDIRYVPDRPSSRDGEGKIKSGRLVRQSANQTRTFFSRQKVRTNRVKRQTKSARDLAQSAKSR